MSVEACSANGGFYLGDYAFCTEQNCKQVACCILDDPCALLSEYECSRRDGVELGDKCDPDPCKLYACCLPDGSCDEYTLKVCESSGGIPTEDAKCNDWSCPEGPCCVLSGECEMQTEAQCWSIEGQSFVNTQETCAPDPCVRGACCYPAGECLEVQTYTCREEDRRDFQGAGSVCTDESCPTGACCLPGGSCDQLIALACEQIAGAVYLGDGSDCEEGTCDALRLAIGSLPTAIYRMAYTHTLPPAIGGDGDYTYTLEGLPEGLVFDPATRRISGKPLRHGSFDLTYTVTDGEGESEQSAGTLEIEPLLLYDLDVCPAEDDDMLAYVILLGNDGSGEQGVDVDPERLVVGRTDSPCENQGTPEDPPGTYAGTVTVTYGDQITEFLFCVTVGESPFGALYTDPFLIHFGDSFSAEALHSGEMLDCCFKEACDESCTFQDGTQDVDTCCRLNPPCTCAWGHVINLSYSWPYWQYGVHFIVVNNEFRLLSAAWGALPDELRGKSSAFCAAQEICVSPNLCNPHESYEENYEPAHFVLPIVPTLEQQLERLEGI
ncbi:MAG: putative Ig domain-containing protein [Deltaproteobacteria bacterium]|nr:putative Ig domain-containing protein [Deltaproteobacteria bacterium]